MRLRVSCGKITSSIKPRAPATKGLAKRALYSASLAASLAGFALVFAENDLYGAFGTHHRDFSIRPGKVDITSQMLRCHHIVRTAIGFAGNNRYFWHRAFGIGIEQFGPAFDDAPYYWLVPA